jgi:hypothetical protein
VLVCPPVQFSKGNLENHRRALRGELDVMGNPYRPVPFADLAPGEPQLSWISKRHWHRAVEDGGRFFLKENMYGLVQVNETRLGDLEAMVHSTGQSEDFAWITKNVLRMIFVSRTGQLANGHLRSVCSLLV